ncbi:hypothetical protein BV898_19737 [Hypsibius exemplaris]|uniref:HTH CENPB-type domain-containing protein n=1 Tax=Hypsibius exemplaris TaxID=2072580 RepID=A0A9X6RPD4_HYPEX|nr:hypothetical protein BV898_19737 [Hypsibius exemplaris]
MKINPLNVFRRLVRFYENEFKESSAEINGKELKLADEIASLIDHILDSSEMSVENETELDIEDEMAEIDFNKIHDYWNDDDDDDNDDDDDINSADGSTPPSQPSLQHSSYRPSHPEKAYTFVSLEDKIKHRFKFISHRRYLYSWEAQIGDGGSRNNKLTEIWKETLAAFRRAKRQRLPIHDGDLRRFALTANKSAGLLGFKATLRWVQTFKKANRIVSRKITKFVTEKSVLQDADIQQAGVDFVKDVKPLMEYVGLDNVKNTDQTGFNREMHSGRTLADKGVKQIESKMQSANAMTHSYTIQPILSAAGVLAPKMLVVIQENSGKFGPIVKKSLPTTPNLVIRASKSGKLDKAILKDFYKEVFFTGVTEPTLLLVDSWGAHMDEVLVDECKPKDLNLNVRIIPPGTTGKVQPFDVFYFRQKKAFIKFVDDRVIIDDIPFILHQRNSLIQLQSLTHNQFCSPRFRAAWQYPWYKAGYLDERPPQFDTPVEFCFKGPGVDAGDSCRKCTDSMFLKCGWCQEKLCFAHWWGLGYDSNGELIKCHYCTHYID